MAGQIEQLNFLGVLQRPSFNGLAVMHRQVVQYQEHFALYIFDQRPIARHLSTDLSVSIFEKTQTSCALQTDGYKTRLPPDNNPLIFVGVLTGDTRQNGPRLAYWVSSARATSGNRCSQASTSVSPRQLLYSWMLNMRGRMVAVLPFCNRCCRASRMAKPSALRSSAG